MLPVRPWNGSLFGVTLDKHYANGWNSNVFSLTAGVLEIKLIFPLAANWPLRGIVQQEIATRLLYEPLKKYEVGMWLVVKKDSSLVETLPSERSSKEYVEGDFFCSVERQDSGHGYPVLGCHPQNISLKELSAIGTSSTGKWRIEALNLKKHQPHYCVISEENLDKYYELGTQPVAEVPLEP